jgi:hypothetical protein
VAFSAFDGRTVAEIFKIDERAKRTMRREFAGWMDAPELDDQFSA